MLFTERLSWLMERNNTSVSELARAVGVSRQAIMGWKDGAQPTVDNPMDKAFRQTGIKVNRNRAYM